MRNVHHEPKKPEGERCFAPGFGFGTIVKEGPEQSLIVWDDPSFNPSASSGSFTPNSHIKKVVAKDGEPSYHHLPVKEKPRAKLRCEACGTALQPEEEEFGFCTPCLETD